jgi:FlaA1/EpsC-like NDP-sugar epimerase
VSEGTSTHKLIYAALAVPLLTALVYVISFGYQYGRLSAFGLAEEFISFNPTQLLIAVKILAIYLLFLFAVTILAADNFNLKLKNATDQEKLTYQVLLINILAFAIAKTLNLTMMMLPKLLILVAVLIAYLMLVRLIDRFAAKKRKSVRKKSEIFGIKYGDSDFQEFFNQSKRFKTIAILSLSTFVIGLTSHLTGIITTQFNKSFYQISDKPDYVVVTKNDGKLLLAGFDTKTYKLNDKYLIIPMDDSIEITTNRYIPLKIPNENGKSKL